MASGARVRARAWTRQRSRWESPRNRKGSAGSTGSAGSRLEAVSKARRTSSAWPAAARVSPCAADSHAWSRGVAVPFAMLRAWVSWSMAAAVSSRSRRTKACSAVAWASSAGESASRAALLARS